MGDDVIMTSFKFSPIVHISNSIVPTNIAIGTNMPTQQHNVHLMINIKVILMDDEGHMRRSKVTKN